MSTSANFFPRQRGDREQQKFGADNVANAPSTLVILQVGGKVQNGTYTAGDAAILNLDTEGRLKVVGSLEITGGANEATVDGGRLQVGGSVQLTDGTNVAGITSAGLLKVSVSGITGSVRIGNGADVFAGITPDSRLQVEGSTRVIGRQAHDAAITNENDPVLLGGEAKAVDGTDPGSVSEGDVTRLKASQEGLLLVNPAHPRLFSATAAYSSTQNEVEVKATPGAGLALYVSDIVLSVGENEGTIKLMDGNAGGVITDLVSSMRFAANGGAVMNFQQPLRLTADSSLSLSSSGTIGPHSITVSGYIAS